MLSKLLLFTHLVKEYYILYFNGQLVITNKFYREFNLPMRPLSEDEVMAELGKRKVGVVRTTGGKPVTIQEAFKKPSTEITVTTSTVDLPVLPALNSTMPLLQFISDASVPEKVYMKDGTFYWANRFSNDAEKTLLKALKDGIQYDILLAATRLYYKGGGQPKAISGYFKEGTWKQTYHDMLTSLKDGTTASHIKKNIDTEKKDGNTRYKR